MAISRVLDTTNRDYGEAPHWTWRSLIVGCLLGTVISASNFYLGFKMGWSFGCASIFPAETLSRSKLI